MNQPETLRDGVDMPEAIPSMRTYKCNSCEKVFDAPVGQTTIHECEPKPRRRLAQVI